MPDIKLPDGPNGGDGADRIERQPVPGVTFEPEFLRRLGGVLDALELPVPFRAFGVAIGAGMKLHHRHSQIHRRLKLGAFRLDE